VASLAGIVMVIGVFAAISGFFAGVAGVSATVFAGFLADGVLVIDG
jgi:hypothetical protein